MHPPFQVPDRQLICHHIKTRKVFWRPTTWFNVTAPSPTETRKKGLPQARKAREEASSKRSRQASPSIVRQEKHDENDTHSRRCVVGNDSRDKVRTSEKERKQIAFGHWPVCCCAKTRQSALADKAVDVVDRAIERRKARAARKAFIPGKPTQTPPWPHHTTKESAMEPRRILIVVVVTIASYLYFRSRRKKNGE